MGQLEMEVGLYAHVVPAGLNDQRTSYSERSQHPLSQLDKYLGDNVLYRVSFFNA